jgi:hypothetical protein
VDDLSSGIHEGDTTECGMDYDDTTIAVAPEILPSVAPDGVAGAAAAAVDYVAM